MTYNGPWHHTTCSAIGQGDGGMEPVARVTVTVTFLRMDRPPAGPSPGYPTGYQVVTVQSPTVGFYRYLYTTVGADHVWWLRRTMRTRSWRCCCAIRRYRSTCCTAAASRQVLELDGRGWPDVNLSYFGLMPHPIGARIGYPFLRSAVDAVWRQNPRGMTVNTYRRSSACAANVSASRLPNAASGARDMERAAAPRDANSRTIADVTPMMRGHRAL